MTAVRARFSPYLYGLCVLAIGFVFLIVPPIRQDENFHLFADGRTIFGIPNFWNVASNIPFLLIGVVGLTRTRTARDRALFAGVLITAFGSAYYHLLPNDARLVWDRIPMTIIFMAFLSCALESERALLPLLAIGISSVLWWRVTGDLRPYGVVKFAPMLLVLPVMFEEKKHYIAGIVAVFGAAQLLELNDRAVYSLLPLSGHTLKHLTAELATWLMLGWRAAR